MTTQEREKLLLMTILPWEMDCGPGGTWENIVDMFYQSDVYKSIPEADHLPDAGKEIEKSCEVSAMVKYNIIIQWEDWLIKHGHSDSFEDIDEMLIRFTGIQEYCENCINNKDPMMELICNWCHHFCNFKANPPIPPTLSDTHDTIIERSGKK